MFSTSEIVASCNRKSFDRGVSLADKADSLRNLGYAKVAGGTEIYGDVRSTSGIADWFHCCIDCDADAEQIYEGFCDCPASHKHPGLCKHCVALALTFKRDPNSFEGFEDSLTPKTSRSVRAFLEKTPDFGSLHAAQGSIRLDVRLTNEFGDWTARFKVGNAEATYVVSDITAMARAIAGRTYLEYGKKLGFVHTLDAFDEASVPLARLIGEIGNRTSSARRDLKLDEGEVVRLLDALGANIFNYVDDTNAHAPLEVRIEDADPDLGIRIVRADEGGYEVLRDEEIEVLSGSGTSYVIAGERIFRTSAAFEETAAFLHDVYQSSDERIFIASEDIKDFCRKVLPMLEQGANIDEPPELESLKPVKPHFSFYLDCEGRKPKEAITVRAEVSYKGITATVGEFNDEDDFFRDEKAESDAVAVLGRFFDEEEQIPLSDEEKAGEFLYEGVALLQSIGDVYTTPAFDRLLNDRSVRVQIGLSVHGNLIDMDVHSTDVPKEELAGIMESMRLKKRFHRLGDGTIASIEDLDLRNLERMARDLDIGPEDIRSGSIQLPTYHAFFLDREYAEAERDEAFDAYIERFDNDDMDSHPVPERLEAVLRPYQAEGFRWMKKLSSIGFGGILADEMGLGKSIQAIAYIEDLADEWKLDRPALIVSPASLVYNWEEEFGKFSPELKVSVIDGSKADRMRKRSEKDVQVFIASYDAVRMDAEEFQNIHYSAVILDEAQFIKNQATKTSRAVRRLKADHRFALTGTPIENRLSEIWSIFDFLMPGFLGSYSMFKKRYEIDIMGGDEGASERLRSLIGPFVLRRLKSDVIDELPDKQETVLGVPLGEAQMKMYLAEEQALREALLEQRRARSAARHAGARARSEAEGLRVDVLAELMRLRQIALDPALAYEGFEEPSAKTEAVMELVEQSIENGKKTLVFSQFTSYLDILKAQLESEGIKFYEITGATPKRKRVDLVNAFNEDDTPVFLISLKAGGTGLNLVGASVVIHTDPWWNAAATDQATDRAHRIGQQNMVSVYKVVAKGTIEERIMNLQESKRELASSIVAETSAQALSSMTREDLEELLLY